ncbi:MAG: hypothetical protein AAFW73_16545 [Bacteroidota bacterium]
MKNNAIKNSSKLSSIKFIKGIRSKIKKSESHQDNDGLYFLLKQA